MVGVNINTGNEGVDVKVGTNPVDVKVEVGGEKGGIDDRLKSLEERIGDFNKIAKNSSTNLNDLRKRVEEAKKSQDPKEKAKVVREGEALLKSKGFETELESLINNPLLMEELAVAEDLIGYFQRNPGDKNKLENLDPAKFVKDAALLSAIKENPKIWDSIVQNAADGHDIFTLLANRDFKLSDKKTWVDPQGKPLEKAGSTIGEMIKNNSKLLIGAAIGIPAILLLTKFGKAGKWGAGILAGILGFSFAGKAFGALGIKPMQWIFEKLGIKDFMDQVAEVKESVLGGASSSSKPPETLKPVDEIEPEGKTQKEIEDNYNGVMENLKKTCHWSNMAWEIHSADKIVVTRGRFSTEITRKGGKWSLENDYAKGLSLERAAALANLVNFAKTNVDPSKAENSRPFEVDGDGIDFKLKASLSASWRQGFGLLDQEFMSDKWMKFYRTHLKLSQGDIAECLNNWFASEGGATAPTE